MINQCPNCYILLYIKYCYISNPHRTKYALAVFVDMIKIGKDRPFIHFNLEFNCFQPSPSFFLHSNSLQIIAHLFSIPLFFPAASFPLVHALNPFFPPQYFCDLQPLPFYVNMAWLLSTLKLLLAIPYPLPHSFCPSIRNPSYSFPYFYFV